MAKTKNILKNALPVLKNAGNIEKLREAISETVGKAVRDVLGDELSKVVLDTQGTAGEETSASVAPAAPAVPAVTFKELLADLDKDKLKAFIEGLDKAKVKAWIDAADKDALKLLVDSADKDELIRYVDQLESGEAPSQEAPEKEKAEEVPSCPPSLDWCYGKFNGSKANISDDAVLKSATLKGDTLSFEWAKGDCRNIGATSKTDADHTVACLFLANGKGGKFEWISTSRKTRSMKNIKDGYNGWPKKALDDGGKLFFCIAGVKDDQSTSNGLRTALVEVQR